ncbi:MAG: DUF4256 domain-containing protein [Phycisphaerales bacterium]|nr:DUF4256 domain-containing protein [Phycisphaerales bacterium]
MSTKNKLSPERAKSLLHILETRFEQHQQRHKALEWAAIKNKLDAQPAKLWSLNEMEETGGEPDVVAYNKKTDTYVFYDCAAESPKKRRSLCYDAAAWESRKENKPKGSAVAMAKEMGVELLNEEQYRELQSLGQFDAKTSSWLAAPDSIRKLGGAIFADFRFGRVFVYHNGAESYYAARGFRASLAL